MENIGFPKITKKSLGKTKQNKPGNGKPTQKHPINQQQTKINRLSKPKAADPPPPPSSRRAELPGGGGVLCIWFGKLVYCCFVIVFVEYFVWFFRCQVCFCWFFLSFPLYFYGNPIFSLGLLCFLEAEPWES